MSAHARELRKICSKRGKIEDAFAVFQHVSFFMLFMSFSVNFLTLEALRGGGVKLTPLDIFGFKFFFLTDCQKLWHNCSLFVNTSFDTN